ncbi:sugar transferase [Syntrophobotulus glycolicus]|nr:sugar transferase [Syntrophobotulus glycolicus]
MIEATALKKMIDNAAAIHTAHEPGKTNLSNDDIIMIEQLCSLKNGFVYRSLKRLLDLAVSLNGLLILFFPMLLIGVWIKLDSEGPALFTQERLGLNGKPFRLFKFRSMRIDAEADGPRWASKEDDRLTRVGRLIRKTRLDELPQLLNILTGHMSLVGPRPERKIFYDQFETYIHGFHQRLMVKPGLTGLAQVNGGYDLLPEEKILLDVEYMKNQSLVLDIQLILKTVVIVFNHHGAR